MSQEQLIDLYNKNSLINKINPSIITLLNPTTKLILSTGRIT